MIASVSLNETRHEVVHVAVAQPESSLRKDEAKRSPLLQCARAIHGLQSDVWCEEMLQLQAQHAKRPWGEFFKKFSTPKDSNRAVSRLKCNLYYYRVNYAQVFAAVTGGCIIRNPAGALSLALMATGAALYIDSIASTVSGKVMLLIAKFDSKLASQIQSSPGGHDGQRYTSPFDLAHHQL